MAPFSRGTQEAPPLLAELLLYLSPLILFGRSWSHCAASWVSLVSLGFWVLDMFPLCLNVALFASSPDSSTGPWNPTCRDILWKASHNITSMMLFSFLRCHWFCHTHLLFMPILQYLSHRKEKYYSCLSLPRYNELTRFSGFRILLCHRDA